MIALWTVLSAASAACPSLIAELDAAEQALQVFDLPAAESYLDNAEAAMACGTLPDKTQIARFFFLDGAVYQFNGDATSAIESYRAALKLDAQAGLDGFESAVADLVVKAKEGEAGTGSVDVSPTLVEPWKVAVDGASVALPAPVMEGLHLVQFTDAEGAVFEGKIIAVTSGQAVVVNHELPATPPQAERVRNPVATSGTLRLGFGASLAAGQAQSATVDGTTFREPSVKASTPVSLGFQVGVGPVFFEPEGHFGALLDGHYLTEGSPAPEATKLAWGFGLNAGATVGKTDLGVGGGTLFPGRFQGYGLARLRPFKRAPVSLALRAGVRSAHRLGAEPMVGLTVAYDLGLF
ncbi:MAG: hypothetical protein KC912_21520 [Proteobacteria bacterium]|nr:hypothetical protein [Pseudomonadota bacterium]